MSKTMCAALVALGILGCQTAGTNACGWESLFNGKDLSGWIVKCKPADAAKTFWRVEDGVIVCDTAGDRDHDYVWLMTDAEYGDFELELEIQSHADCPGNSGVQVRSRYNDAILWLDGPQIDIHPPTPWRSGHVYDETRGTRRWICPSLPDSGIQEDQVNATHAWRHAGEGAGWNTVRIRCEGTRIRTFINGTPVVDYDGAGLLDDAEHQEYRVGMAGHIALQLHIRDDLTMRYRNLRLRRL